MTHGFIFGHPIKTTCRNCGNTGEKTAAHDAFKIDVIGINLKADEETDIPNVTLMIDVTCRQCGQWWRYANEYVAVSTTTGVQMMQGKETHND